MTIQSHLKRKTIIRSSFVFVIVFSILLSSISISFAYSEGAHTTPDNLISTTPTQSVNSSIYYGPNATRENLAYITNEVSRVVTMIQVPSGNNTNFLYTITSYNELIIVPNGIPDYNYGVYSRTPRDNIHINNYGFSSAQYINTYYTSNTPVSLNGFSGDWYRCADQALLDRINQPNGNYYCNANVVVIQNNSNHFLASENLDVSAYLPQPEYIFNAIYNDEISNIRCEVNFNPRVYDSFVTIWGYNEYGGILYIYNSDEYNMLLEDEQDNEPETYFFYLDVTPLFISYIGSDFHISSISCMGWDDAHEEYLSVSWDISESNHEEYDPPSSSYYDTYVYNSNYYTTLNRLNVSFGNVDIRIHSDNEIGNVFWDYQETIIAPYKYSYLFLPQIDYIEGYESVLKELCLEFDIVFTNCNDNLVDSIYGIGTSQSLRDSLLSTTRSFLLRVRDLNKSYHTIPYSYRDNLPTTFTEYSCCCLYTDSFYYKSLAYFFGDTNNLLLELESRLFDEDGSFDLLFQNMKNSYNNDYSYYSDMIQYMDKLNYLVHVVTDINYFNNVLKYLKTLSEKDFTIDLPEFDFTTVIGKYPDSNLYNLTDFISHSVSELPTWDFSSLSTFTDAIGGLFTSVAPDGEFIENISNPYSFGDSVEDDLFPDSE